MESISSYYCTTRDTVLVMENISSYPVLLYQEGLYYAYIYIYIKKSYCLAVLVLVVVGSSRLSL